jgi:hypothetical protein
VGGVCVGEVEDKDTKYNIQQMKYIVIIMLLSFLSVEAQNIYTPTVKGKFENIGNLE